MKHQNNNYYTLLFYDYVLTTSYYVCTAVQNDKYFHSKMEHFILEVLLKQTFTRNFMHQFSSHKTLSNLTKGIIKEFI